MYTDCLLAKTVFDTFINHRGSPYHVLNNYSSGGQYSQLASPSVFRVEWNGLQIMVRLSGGARTEYARECEDWVDIVL